jgi:glycosyltransferase involved in cell wall biosynthesis
MAGPGIRYYNLARELARSHDVTLVVPNRDSGLEESFAIVGTPDFRLGSFRSLARNADVIVAQHLGPISMSYLTRLDAKTIYDLYVPFATENLPLHAGEDAGARSSYRRLAYGSGVAAQRLALAAGDAFICASERQRDLWLGVLSAIGRIDLGRYGDDPGFRDLIDVVPFGLEAEPPRPTGRVLKGVVEGIGDTDKVLLWGGGVFNWFDPLTVIKAVETVAASRDDVKLFFLGMRHPNPVVGMTKMAADAISLSDSLGLTGRHVFFNLDWVSYDERRNYFLEADVGLSSHFDTIETRFAFRTRLLDYFWAGLPCIVTTGDVLGDLVAERGLGRTVGFQDVDGWADAIAALLDDPAAYDEARTRVAEVREEFIWQNVVGNLARLVELPKATRHGRTRLGRHLLDYYAHAGGSAVVNPRVLTQTVRRRWRP